MSEIKAKKENVQRALDAIAAGTTLRAAARMYNIRVSTLYDKKNSVNRRDAAGKPTVLSSTEEQEIVSWLKDMAAAGHPICEEILKINVAQYAKKLGKAEVFKSGIPSRGWVQRFLTRHPTISRRTANPISKRRIVTPDQIRLWFDEVEQYLLKNDNLEVLNDANRIFNMDESSFEMAPSPQKKKVFAKRGTKNVQSIQGNSNRESYTVLMAGSASGVFVPPLILFPYKERMPRDIVQSIPSGWGVGRTDSGWMNSGAFYEYMTNVFYPWLVKNNVELPVIVFVDGHRSHATYDTVQFCKDRGIILVCLPPNSTHFIQPLDVSFFKPMKAAWDTALVKWRFANGGAMISKRDFAPLLKQALESMKNIDQTLINGFRKCGLHPWNAEAIDYESFPDSGAVPQNELQNKNPSLDSADHVDKTIPATIFLRELNRRLPSETLEAFERQRRNLMWTGDLEASHLFNFWRSVQEEVEGPLEYYEIDPSLIGLDLTLDVDGNDLLCDEATLEIRDQNNDLIISEDTGHLPREELQPENDESVLELHEVEEHTPDCISNAFENILHQQNRAAPAMPEKATQSNRYPETQKSFSRKRRCAPAVATSDAWVEIYEEEEEIKNQLRNAKRQRQEERKQKSVQKQQEKELKAALRLQKQQERDKLRERKKIEQDALKVEKQKQRSKENKKRLRQLRTNF